VAFLLTTNRNFSTGLWISADSALHARDRLEPRDLSVAKATFEASPCEVLMKLAFGNQLGGLGEFELLVS
jgi:hypothetical protein